MNTESFTRIKLLKIWEVLTEYSSAGAPLSTSDIIKRLTAAGVPCDRRTLYGDIDVLIGCGYDVKVIRSKENLYYTEKSNLTKEDLFIISESVRQNKNIAISKTNAIIKDLNKLSFAKSRDKVPQKTAMPLADKTFTGDVYENVFALYKAVRQNKCVEITTFSYGADKKAGGGAAISISPLDVVFYGGTYYLAYYDGKILSSIPIRNVKDIKVLSMPAKKPKISLSVLDSRIAESVCGKIEKVTFIADNGLIDGVIDKFGELVDFVRQGESKVSFTVETAVNDRLFGWCLAFGGKLKINAPLKVKKQYEDFIKAAYHETFGK